MGVKILTPEQVRAQQRVDALSKPSGRHDGSPPKRDPNAPPPPVPGSKEARMAELEKLSQELDAIEAGKKLKQGEEDTLADAQTGDGSGSTASVEDVSDHLFVVPDDLVVDFPEPRRNPKLEHKFREIDGLPSNYHFYDWKALRIRPFAWEDVIDLAVARSTQNMKFMLEVVARVIDQPIAELTVGDFVYICYWLRINSYPKSPVVVTWGCRKCGHENVTKIHSKTTAIIEIEHPVEIGEDFEVPRMRNYLEYIQAVAGQPPEVVGMLDIAMWVRARTLGDKLVRLHESDDLSLMEGARATMLTVGSHGVQDRIEAECGAYSPGGCGEVNRVRLEAPLLNFLSGI